MQVITKREESIHGNQVRLEEKSRECSILTRQLEDALEDARRQVRIRTLCDAITIHVGTKKTLSELKWYKF